MSQKVFVFDIDGTLITDSGEIETSTLNAVEEVYSKGNKVILASARPLKSIREIASNFDGVEFEGLVGLNGSVAFVNEASIYSCSLRKKYVRKVLEITRSYEVCANLMTKEYWFLEEENKYSQEEAEIVGMKPRKVDDLLRIDEEVFKILLLGDSDEISIAKNELNRKIGAIKATISKPEYCEIINSEASKAVALKKVVQEINKKFQEAEIVVFGDGENDIKMMELADTSIAMGNSEERVKKVADYVTKGNNNNGIKFGLNEFKLLEDD